MVTIYYVPIDCLTLLPIKQKDFLWGLGNCILRNG